MARIYIDTVCGLFHWRHVELFRQARYWATDQHLIVGLNDAEAICYKGRPMLSLDERRAVIRGIPEYIRSDNGSEFTAKQIRDWLGRVSAKMLCITLGSLLIDC